MFERAVRLCLVVHKLLFCACHTALLFNSQLVQTSQRKLDALDRPNRIRGVQVRGIRGTTPDEQIGMRSSSWRSPSFPLFSLTQNIEATKVYPRLHCLIVSP